MKKMLSLSLIFCLLLTAFAGCGSNDDDGKKDAKESTASVSESAAEKNDGGSESGAPLITEKLSASKVFSFTKADGVSLTLEEGGIVYRENELYGIISYDGKKDTGAIYKTCEAEGAYFIVSKADETEIPKTVEEANIYGIVGPDGVEIIPTEYAQFYFKTDYFVFAYKAVKATQATANNKTAMFGYDESGYFGSASSDAVSRFDAEWSVIDLRTGKKLEGASGTDDTLVTGYGNCISFNSKTNPNAFYDSNGKQIKGDVHILDYGGYYLRNDNTVTVYSDDSKLVLTYDMSTTDFYAYGVKDGKAMVRGGDGDKYYLVDSTGTAVTGGFDKDFEVYGGIVWMDYQLYKLDGTLITDANYDLVYSYNIKSGFYKGYTYGGGFVIVDNSGNIMYKSDGSDGVDEEELSLSRETDDTEYCYCYKTGKFDIKGYDNGMFTAESYDDNYDYFIVDTLSGDTLISGYEDYSSAVLSGGTVYVVGDNSDGTFDLYAIK